MADALRASRDAFASNGASRRAGVSFFGSLSVHGCSLALVASAAIPLALPSTMPQEPTAGVEVSLRQVLPLAAPAPPLQAPTPEPPTPELPAPELPAPELPTSELPAPELPTPSPALELPSPEPPAPELPSPEPPAPEPLVPGPSAKQAPGRDARPRPARALSERAGRVSRPAARGFGGKPPREARTFARPASTRAAVLSRARPEYPRRCRRRGHKGVVTVAVRVADDGRVARAGIARSAGCQRLDTAALEAVREFRFRPATLGGRPVASDERIEVRFESPATP